MKIQKRRIRKVSPNVSGVQKGRKIVIGLQGISDHLSALGQLGFESELQDGQSLLPSPVGPVSKFNAEGDYLVHKDQPKVTDSFQRYWCWTEWHGKDEVEQCKTVDVPFERYPRTFIDPPSVELTVARDPGGNQILVTEAEDYNDSNEEAIKHKINLFLEIFGECDVLHESLDAIIRAPITRLNWEVLPQGNYPWRELRGRIQGIIEKESEGNQIVIEERLEKINSYEPEFVAVGRAGFSGYLVFGFPGKGFYVLESLYYGNATYVFDRDWHTLSQLTKSEIINGGLYLYRIVHRKSWFGEIARVLN